MIQLRIPLSTLSILRQCGKPRKVKQGFWKSVLANTYPVESCCILRNSSTWTFLNGDRRESKFPAVEHLQQLLPHATQGLVVVADFTLLSSSFFSPSSITTELSFKMKFVVSCLLLFLAAVAQALSATGARLLTIWEDVDDQKLYSKFIGDLESMITQRCY